MEKYPVIKSKPRFGDSISKSIWRLNLQIGEEKGQLLVELLIAIAILAIIAVAVSQVTGVSFQSSKVGGQRTVALNIAQEELDAAKAVSKESWHNIYSLATSTPPTILNKYHSSNSGADCGSVKWCLVSGEIQQVYNTVTYTKYLYIEDVSRTGLDIDSSYNSANNDPSTQKVTAVVSWQGGSVDISDSLTRARNAGAVQTSWSGGVGANAGSGENDNFDNTYSSADSVIDTSGGTLKLNQQ